VIETDTAFMNIGNERMTAQLHALSALILGKVPRYILNRGLNGPQSWFRLLENTSRKISCSFRDSDPTSSSDCADITWRYRVCLLK
jgi:hypothetical protein